MSDTEEIAITDDFIAEEPEAVVEAVAEPTPGTSKSNLAKRRVIDNLLEERRLSKQLADYDFDI